MSNSVIRRRLDLGLSPLIALAVLAASCDDSSGKAENEPSAEVVADDEGSSDGTSPSADDDAADDDAADDDAADDDANDGADDDGADDDVADDDGADDDGADDDGADDDGADDDAADDDVADDDGADDDGAAGLCGAAAGQLFDDSYPWNQRAAAMTLDAESAAIIGYLQTNHTANARFRIDGPSDMPNSLYGITVLRADNSTPHESFEASDSFYSPDCDPAAMPIPEGAIEGEAAFACEDDGDCHFIVIDEDECRLYEMWRANRTDSSFEGGCLAVWDLNAPYVNTLRGDCCTSADAAGLPIAAHMFNADEVAAGVIPHALRFILPNALMRDRIYVRPATHSTGATSGTADAPPYGARLRLKADVDISGLGSAAQVVAVALQQYGMILSDGGNITFTATNDRFTTSKWADVGLEPGDLTSLEWSDFEVVELGERFVWDGACDCQRTPITE